MTVMRTVMTVVWLDMAPICPNLDERVGVQLQINENIYII